MGRPSKLTEKQWAEVGRRVAKGESVSSLGREYGISKARISERFSKRTETLKAVARQVAEAELAFDALPVSERCSVRSLADDLKGLTSNLAAAGYKGAQIANRLTDIALGVVDQMKPDDPFGDQIAALKGTSMLVATANEAAKIGVGLIASNKAAFADDGNNERSGPLVVAGMTAREAADAYAATLHPNK